MHKTILIIATPYYSMVWGLSAMAVTGVIEKWRQVLVSFSDSFSLNWPLEIWAEDKALLSSTVFGKQDSWSILTYFHQLHRDMFVSSCLLDYKNQSSCRVHSSAGQSFCTYDKSSLGMILNWHDFLIKRFWHSLSPDLNPLQTMSVCILRKMLAKLVTATEKNWIICKLCASVQ